MKGGIASSNIKIEVFTRGELILYSVFSLVQRNLSNSGCVGKVLHKQTFHYNRLQVG
jgi:hypothetical protein